MNTKSNTFDIFDGMINDMIIPTSTYARKQMKVGEFKELDQEQKESDKPVKND
eukprot:CAMPEP_0116882462 /NCGR_PEP_ID=MMETSP0463-20121206/14699_1 /TAXON_ID=181622 /ORGANISM="Strombidinopsis sp, Strain SopsisLIS2011" /LENGTH=52 /DNA_ID=CAMNT_0004535681 /DNA_START=1331 /DNA_END=1489 /DNA_ORIENTATION=+